MRNRLTSLVFLGTVWGLSTAVNAAERPMSYAADGKCFCNLPIPTSLSTELVRTPIGGQSLAQVCERVGKGPGLEKTGDSFNYPVFQDAQCGHGPGLSGFAALLSDAGMKEGEAGPKWDLTAAYSDDDLMAQSTALADTDADESINSGEALRFRTRYIKAPASTKSANARPNVVSHSTTASTDDAAMHTSSQTAEQRRLIEELPLATLEPLEGADANNQSADVETVAAVINEPLVAVDVPAATSASATATAIRVPSSTRSAQARRFEYLSVMPMGYDFGGGGVQLSGSAVHNDNVRLIARVGLAEEYQEAMLGVSYLHASASSDRLTFALTGGFEVGQFDLEAGNREITSSSAGGVASAKAIFDVNRRFELQGGLGYSSFFEGDPHAFGAALFHMTQKLDFIGEFEVGDNDSAGIGIRYHY